MKYNHNYTKLKSTLTISFHWNASTTNMKLFHTEAVMQLKQQAVAVGRTGNNPTTGNSILSQLFVPIVIPTLYR